MDSTARVLADCGSWKRKRRGKEWSNGAGRGKFNKTICPWSTEHTGPSPDLLVSHRGLTCQLTSCHGLQQAWSSWQTAQLAKSCDAWGLGEGHFDSRHPRILRTGGRVRESSTGPSHSSPSSCEMTKVRRCSVMARPIRPLGWALL